ncbi:MAG: hypothetical protein LBL97_06865 [Prevotellaceae bacterium]|jgi:hypothetical protein|nr:hypothetical protein [Prevotellaceae bacterium]
MKIKNLLLVAAISCFTQGNAQDNLSVILKDGSTMVGYISRQRPGENFTFTTKSAVILKNTDKVKSIIDHQIKTIELSKEWKNWADENEALIGIGNNAYLILSDIITDNGTISRVRILERGVKVKYLELIPNSYSLSWDTIAMIKAAQRPKLQLSGINRKYRLRSGMEYEGQYVEEVPGKTLSLYQDNGVIHVFNRDEVLQDNRYKINPNQTLFEQSDLIDIVQLKNGSLHKGIIFERNYSDADTISNDYLLIQHENGSTESIDLADVLEYRKERNPLYRPLTDVLLQDGEFMVNRMLTKPQMTKEEENVICVRVDSIQTIISASHPTTEIVIETQFANSNQATQLKLVKVKKDYGRKRNIPGFTYEDIVKTTLQPNEIVTSINGTTKIVYAVSDSDIYAIYNPENKKVILFQIV